MKVRHAVATMLAVCHLVFVYWGGFGLPLAPDDTSAAEIVQYYKHLTGSARAFTFFAPGVASERRATFVLTDEAGHSWTDELRVDRNQEANLHIHTSLFSIMYAEVRHDVAASWASQMLSRHPDAQQVVVQFEMRSLPTLEEFRTGTPMHWVMMYEATFYRPDPETSPQAPRGR